MPTSQVLPRYMNSRMEMSGPQVLLRLITTDLAVYSAELQASREETHSQARRRYTHLIHSAVAVNSHASRPGSS